ncbi:hypothetical protein [Nocardioides sp. cx-173]|uniref:hypothetical protein n=1 Tax=Nocardioides sp. cx-173 TaxID=2898796 RepID=UPI001E2A80FF|nr:hypothetical protein [Nocardioides sp. cx-173]MCD4524997.1 hypothetical protein [Nocardioides sp. cx-173]UGB40295.1 hypothetical protein LQ940_12955 [Nocardioides sp. cx-173]
MREIDVDQLAAALPGGALVIDVREPDVLLAQGVDAVNVTGGTSAWVRSGRPVARGAEAGAAR